MSDEREERDEAQLAETARSTLRVLARRTPVTTGWLAADTVRRAVLIRRRRRWSITAGVVAIAATVTALSVGGGGSGDSGRQALATGPQHVANRIGSAVQLVADNAPRTAADPAAVRQVVAAEQKLAIALLGRLGEGRNVSVSPASLYLALGMLQNGARGQTQTQIATALQAGGLGTADQNVGLTGLVGELNAAAAKDGITLDSANSLWQQRGFQLRPDFLATLAAYYRTGVWQVDYAHDMTGALKSLNDWTAQQTHGNITKLFDQLDPQTVLVLANAIYFHAAWATPFDENRTADGTFTTAAGTPVQAKFMTGGAGLQAAVADGYQAVQLPYTGGRFAALAVMPTGGSLGEFVRTLSPDKLASIASNVHAGVPAMLPRFTTTATLDLKPVLQSLGMTTAFSDAADLSGLSAESTKVDQVIQRVYLGVGEKGTTAAAATGISVMPTSASAGPQVRLDHPFLFLVRDTRTGTILFAAEIQDPTAG